MANVYFKMKIMPEGVEVDLAKLKKDCTKIIEECGGKVHEVVEEPIAFGLIALIFTALVDESTGGLDPMEEKLKAMDTISNAEVIDVRRAIG